jgi:HNH endonuclease
VIEPYKRNPNTTCSICNKAIYRRPVEIERNKGNVFCDAICYGISCRKEFPCVICGKPILAGLNRKTCSRICSNKNRAGIKYKVGSPKDNVVSQRTLKIRLLKARGEKCERCDYNKMEILHVHHKDRDRNNNSLKNLALICPNCHYEEHYLEKSWLKNMMGYGEVG